MILLLTITIFDKFITDKCIDYPFSNVPSHMPSWWILQLENLVWYDPVWKFHSAFDNCARYVRLLLIYGNFWVIKNLILIIILIWVTLLLNIPNNRVVCVMCTSSYFQEVYFPVDVYVWYSSYIESDLFIFNMLASIRIMEQPWWIMFSYLCLIGHLLSSTFNARKRTSFYHLNNTCTTKNYKLKKYVMK